MAGSGRPRERAGCAIHPGAPTRRAPGISGCPSAPRSGRRSRNPAPREDARCAPRHTSGDTRPRIADRCRPTPSTGRCRAFWPWRSPLRLGHLTPPGRARRVRRSVASGYRPSPNPARGLQWNREIEDETRRLAARGKDSGPWRAVVWGAIWVLWLGTLVALVVLLKPWH